ncbi:MAG TPA: histidine kinase [Gemmatimonadaceae bacterium]|nr:histidine kinase [Gemmatimonadaceae bacterium]
MPAVLAAFETYAQSRLHGRPAPSWRDILFQAGDWLLYAALAPTVFWLAQKFPLQPPHLLRKIAGHFAAALLSCVLWAGCGAIAMEYLDIARAPASFGALWMSWTLTTLPWGVVLYFAVVGTQHAVAYFSEARDREAQSARLAAQLAEARLASLRAQLHPHFLFNSLNAITALARGGQTGSAVRTLELLSELLRDVLRPDRGHEVSLAEEARVLERYLGIEQVRFSDRLRADIDIDAEVLNAAVPVFILQPLVENALRHGLARRSGPGRLVVSARREASELVLAVHDDGSDGQSAGPPDAQYGVGLSNTRERLATLYGVRGKLELTFGPAGTTATIRLPYRVLEGGAAGGVE